MRKILERTLFVLIVLGFGVGLNGCSRSARQAPATAPQARSESATSESASPTTQSGTQSNAPPAIAADVQSTKGKPTGRLDSCTLLSATEIQAIQGEALKETKASAGSARGFNVSQCFFTLPTFTNSISLVLTQKGDAPGARNPKEFWEEMFRNSGEEEESEARERAEAKERASAKEGEKTRERAEEEEESAKALKISRVGDEAFWTGTAVGGALYVLKGNAFLRISIGGVGNQRAQIKRTQALARLILKHL